LETHTLETLWSAPVSLSAIFGAKIAAPVLLAAAQGALWLILLRLNGIDIQNLGLVLLLAILVAALNALGSAFATFSLRDRERSQFLYALFILIAVSASYFFDFSPVKLMTRLAVGDYYVGFFDVAQYAVVLLVLVAVFFHTTRKLAVV
jgi:ABC-type Na+ efflux pump permease subunit